MANKTAKFHIISGHLPSMPENFIKNSIYFLFLGQNSFIPYFIFYTYSSKWKQRKENNCKEILPHVFLDLCGRGLSGGKTLVRFGTENPPVQKLALSSGGCFANFLYPETKRFPTGFLHNRSGKPFLQPLWKKHSFWKPDRIPEWPSPCQKQISLLK